MSEQSVWWENEWDAVTRIPSSGVKDAIFHISLDELGVQGDALFARDGDHSPFSSVIRNRLEGWMHFFFRADRRLVRVGDRSWVVAFRREHDQGWEFAHVWVHAGECQHDEAGDPMLSTMTGLCLNLSHESGFNQYEVNMIASEFGGDIPRALTLVVRSDEV